jgi:hypothetical protein
LKFKKIIIMLTDDDISVSTTAPGEVLHNNTAAAAAAAQKHKPLAQTETRLVLCSKSLVVLVLIASAAVLGYFTWRIMHAEETEDFYAQFAYDGKEIIDTANTQSELLVSVVASFAGLYTSYANANKANANNAQAGASTSSTWPNFTLPVRCTL